MKLEKKHAWFCIGVAVWSFVIWGRFIKALADEHAKGTVEPAGYYPAHIALIVINMILGLVFLSFGIKVLRALGSTRD
ncbi:MAG TPA: hypothetical protein VJ872_14955 [Nocardioides sp.]|nr:hypothetical protein [Nocardioides sp.]